MYTMELVLNSIRSGREFLKDIRLLLDGMILRIKFFYSIVLVELKNVFIDIYIYKKRLQYFHQ